jgi:hypothetical protein
MITDPADDNAFSLADLLGAAAAASRKAAPAPAAGPVTLFVRRLAWEAYPTVRLRYDAVDDTLFARFVAMSTVDEHTIEGRLYVGFDDNGHGARCTTVCLRGFTSDLRGRAPEHARQILGDALWSKAKALAAEGAGDRVVILDPAEAESLQKAWAGYLMERHLWPQLGIASDFRDALGNGADATAANPPGTVRRDNIGPEGRLKVEVISLSDSHLDEVLGQWSAEISNIDHLPRGAQSEPLQSAIYRGLSGLLAVSEDEPDTSDVIIRGEWDVPDLDRIGVHPRLTWQIEFGDPPVLLIQAAPLGPNAESAPDIQHRVEIRFAERTRHEGALASIDATSPDAQEGGRLRRVRISGDHLRSREVARRGRRLLVRGVRGVREVVPQWTRRRPSDRS